MTPAEKELARQRQVQRAYRLRKKAEEQEAKTAGPNIGLYGDAITRASEGRLRVLVPLSRHDREERMLRLVVRNKEGVSHTITAPSEMPPEKVSWIVLELWLMLTGERLFTFQED